MNVKILASLAMPVVLAGVLGGILNGTHHTKLPSLNPPPTVAPPLTTQLMKASRCDNTIRASQPFTGVALTKVSPVAVNAFTAATKSKVSIIEFYSSFPAKFDETAAAYAVAQHALPLVQLNPGKYNKLTLRKIANRADDAKIRAYADAVKAFGYCIVISFGHEMNGWWYRWGRPWNTPATFIKAWRHVHDLFVQAGATNVIWSWDPSHQYDQVTPTKIATPASEWYPGNDYVDWIGLDGYLSLDTNGQPQNFREIFAHQIAYIRSVATGKLLYLAETGVAKESAEVTQINDLFAGIHQYNLAGLIWFEENRKSPWQLAGRAAAIEAYRTGVSQYPKPVTIDKPQS
ncbi:MAG TPA: glycosyl hydrolase [Streptosporangiaceae bacterium]